MKIAEEANHEGIKNEIVKEINSKAKKEEGITKIDDLVLTYVFKQKTLEELDSFKKAVKLHGELQKIVVEILVKINVYYNAKS